MYSAIATAQSLNDSDQRYTERNKLIAQAREGDEEAIENLTIEDMDMYSLLSKRIAKEDILSIVTSYFMPYGIESDEYSILGDILDCTKEKNSLTNEEMYERISDTLKVLTTGGEEDE